MVRKIRFAVVLSGCGNRDGAEIHESVLTLLAIVRNGGEYQCFAPNIMQHHVLNFISGREIPERRNVLTESARIARGKVRDLREFDPAAFDVLVLPGGQGVVKNLSNYAVAGPDFTVNEDVSRALKTMAGLGKPIGALCIAPLIVARVLGKVRITLGDESEVSALVERFGATHVITAVGGIVEDMAYKVVSAPCYMLDARIDQIAEEADRVVKALIAMQKTV